MGSKVGGGVDINSEGQDLGDLLPRLYTAEGGVQGVGGGLVRGLAVVLYGDAALHLAGHNQLAVQAGGHAGGKDQVALPDGGLILALRDRITHNRHSFMFW